MPASRLCSFDVKNGGGGKKSIFPHSKHTAAARSPQDLAARRPPQTRDSLRRNRSHESLCAPVVFASVSQAMVAQQIQGQEVEQAKKQAKRVKENMLCSQQAKSNQRPHLIIESHRSVTPRNAAHECFDETSTATITDPTNN